MSTRTLILAGYAVLVAAAVALQTAARRPGSPVPRVQAVLAAGLRSRPTRTAVVAAWIWLGLHYFAR